MKITYGTKDYNIDVTEICLNKLKTNDIIAIPSGDHNRANYFTDPLPCILKSIFITDEENNITEYDDTLTIKINIVDKKITIINDSMMKIIYRISDGGYNKIKPYYVTKKGIFQHFMKIFSEYDIYIVADNVSDETYNFLCSYIDSSKVFRTKLSNAGSFMYSVKLAINKFNDTTKVYFAEDDYIYTKNAPSIIEEGLDIGDYSSGYDHPDKYINHNEGGPNPYIKDGGENTIVKISKNSHWKITNSCCMTFATRVITIKKDLDIYKKYCSGTHPHDFQIFIELKKYNNRNIVSCIPAVSTHGETANLSPFINWEQEFLQTNNN